MLPKVKSVRNLHKSLASKNILSPLNTTQNNRKIKI